MDKRDQPALLIPLLRRAADKDGRYNASKLADMLDWDLKDMARYLEKGDASGLSRNPAPIKDQPKLATLATFFAELVGLLGGDEGGAKQWLRTPVRLLEDMAPKDKILAHRLREVQALIREMESGFTA